MARIINGVAISDDYEAIVGPIEGYERDQTPIEAKYITGPGKARRSKHASDAPVDTKAAKVTEVDG